MHEQKDCVFVCLSIFGKNVLEHGILVLLLRQHSYCTELILNDNGHFEVGLCLNL